VGLVLRLGGGSPRAGASWGSRCAGPGVASSGGGRRAVLAAGAGNEAAAAYLVRLGWPPLAPRAACAGIKAAVAYLIRLGWPPLAPWATDAGNEAVTAYLVWLGRTPLAPWASQSVAGVLPGCGVSAVGALPSAKPPRVVVNLFGASVLQGGACGGRRLWLALPSLVQQVACSC
jgi:hypothetical protein